jgi:thiamine biosynthesis lipoprotein
VVSSKILSLLLLLPAQDRFVAEEAHMGTVFRITVYADEPQAALRAAFDRIAELDNELSDYKVDSELMRVCRTAYGHPVRVSHDLFMVLEAAQRLAADSGGAFDVTIGPVTRLWRQGRVPSTELPVGYRNLILGDHTVELKLPGMQLDVGGIAKGFAAEEALKVLESRGIARALVAASGDLAIGDPPPGKKGWTVELEPVSGFTRVTELHNTCVGTSGDAEQRMRGHSHIIDPLTGLGLTQHIGVTIVAPSGLQADSLGTAVSVVTARNGATAGMTLVGKYPGVSALIVTKKSDGFAVLNSIPAAKEKRN